VTGGALGTQRFVYDGNAMIAEYNSSGTMLRRVACPELAEGSMAAMSRLTIR
jgi:hypothetical protein